MGVLFVKVQPWSKVQAYADSTQIRIAEAGDQVEEEETVYCRKNADSEKN